MLKSLLAIIFLLSASSPSWASDIAKPAATVAQTSIVNFKQVDPGIFRGGRPGDEGMKELDALGVKTIIDLENEDSAIAAEQATAATLNIKLISYSMDYKTAPDLQEVTTLLADIADVASQPVYVHCKHGEDRTGLIIGLYRVKYDHWTAKAAYSEMLQDHFHPFLKNLADFFTAQTQP